MEAEDQCLVGYGCGSPNTEAGFTPSPLDAATLVGKQESWSVRVQSIFSEIDLFQSKVLLPSLV